jgi:hypothetical protein
MEDVYYNMSNIKMVLEMYLKQIQVQETLWGNNLQMLVSGKYQ